MTGLRIPGTVNVSANNVTLNDLSITVGGDSSSGDSYGVTLDSTANLTIENSNIQGTNTTTGRMGEGIKDVYTDSTGTHVLGNNIQETDTAIQLYQGVIKGNYIHNLGLIEGDHVNGITTNGDNVPLLIQNNTILNNFGQTDAIGLFQDFSTVSNVTINDNFLACGGYTIYGGMGSYGRSSNIYVTNNVISTMYHPSKAVCTDPSPTLTPQRTRQHLVRQHLLHLGDHPHPLISPHPRPSATRQSRRVAQPRLARKPTANDQPVPVPVTRSRVADYIPPGYQSLPANQRAHARSR